jgi:predicted nuclease with TOPRIM domain
MRNLRKNSLQWSSDKTATASQNKEKENLYEENISHLQRQMTDLKAELDLLHQKNNTVEVESKLLELKSIDVFKKLDDLASNPYNKSRMTSKDFSTLKREFKNLSLMPMKS